MVLHLGSLEYTHYMLNIQFYGLREFHKRYFIREIVFYVSIYDINIFKMLHCGTTVRLKSRGHPFFKL